MKNKNSLFFVQFIIVMCLLSFLPALTRAAVATSRIVLTSISNGSWWQENYGLDGILLVGPNQMTAGEYAAGIASLNNSQYTVGTNQGDQTTTITSPENTALFTNAREAYLNSPASSNHNPTAADIATARENSRIAPKTEPGAGSKVINFVIWLLSFSFYFVSLLVGFLIYIAGMVIDFFFSARQLASSTIVQNGWTFTRDTLNFVFILVLLAISFSTIAGIETFQMRKALPSLIFAALLVNFSLAIGGAFLQVSNVLTDSIASSVLQSKEGDKDGVGTKITTGLLKSADIKDFYTYGDVDWLSSMTGLKTLKPTKDITDFKQAMNLDWTEYLSTTIKSALTLIMICIFAVAFIFLAILMAVRLVMLVFLLILSPVPFVFSIIPQAKSYTTMWWDNFIKYVIFLPVVTFFLALAIRLLGEKSGQTPLVAEFFKETPAILTTGGAVAGSIFDMVFVAIFIFAAVMVAQRLGIAGSNAALGAAKKTTIGAAKLGMMPTTLGLKGAAATGKAVGLMAGHGAAKVGLMAADAAGTGMTKVGLGGALGKVRTAGRAAQRLYKGQESRKQIEEKKAALAGMSEDQLRAAYERGNVAAGVKLMENDDLKKDEFAGLAAKMPKGTESYNKVESAWKKKDPIGAIIKNANTREQMGKGPTELDDKVKTKLQDAFTKMKGEDYAKLSAADLKMARNSGISMPMSRSQLKAVADSSNTELQAEASVLVKELEKKEELNPGQQALVTEAKRIDFNGKNKPTPDTSGGKGKYY